MKSKIKGNGNRGKFITNLWRILFLFLLLPATQIKAQFDWDDLDSLIFEGDTTTWNDNGGFGDGDTVIFDWDWDGDEDTLVDWGGEWDSTYWGDGDTVVFDWDWDGNMDTLVDWGGEWDSTYWGDGDTVIFDWDGNMDTLVDWGGEWDSTYWGDGDTVIFDWDGWNWDEDTLCDNNDWDEWEWDNWDWDGWDSLDLSDIFSWDNDDEEDGDGLTGSNQDNNSATSSQDEILESKVALYGNYPNPFSGNTTIRYEVPENMTIKIGIYDGLGHLVADILNDRVSAGTHEIIWNGSREVSGIYFMRMIAGNKVFSKQMILTN